MPRWYWIAKEPMFENWVRGLWDVYSYSFFALTLRLNSQCI